MAVPYVEAGFGVDAVQFAERLQAMHVTLALSKMPDVIAVVRGAGSFDPHNHSDSDRNATVCLQRVCGESSGHRCAVRVSWDVWSHEAS